RIGWIHSSLDQNEQFVVIESMNRHTRRSQGGFNAGQERCELRQKPFVLGASPLHDLARGYPPISSEFLFPLVSGLGLVNHGIPIKHRVQTIIEEFTGGLFCRPSKSALFVNRSQNYIPVSCTPLVIG